MFLHLHKTSSPVLLDLVMKCSWYLILLVLAKVSLTKKNVQINELLAQIRMQLRV